MSPTSVEKWPVELKIVRVAASPVAKLELYLLSGVMNTNQWESLRIRLPVLSEIEFEKDRYMLSTLVNRPQLQKALVEFTRLAKEWRGQYYALANKYVEVVGPVLNQ